MKKQNVTLKNAQEGEYRNVLKQIAESESGCGFCPDNFPKFSKYDIIHTVGNWQIIPNSWPYKNTRYHIVLVYKNHTDSVLDLSDQDWVDYGKAIRWTLENFDIPGGATTMRFGSPTFSGASVNGHLHGMIIVPDVGGNDGKQFERPITDKEFMEHPDAAWFRIG